MKRKLFLLLLVAVLMVTFVPFTAIAAQSEDESILYYDDFEGDKYSGSIHTSVSAATSSEEAVSGERSLKITGYTRTYDIGPEYALTNKIKQGHTYEVSFWAKVAEGSEPMKLWLKLSYNRNGQTSYPTLVSSTEINSDEWKLFKGSYTFTMPLDELASVNIYMETGDDYLGTPFYVDEFLVRDTLSAEPLQEEDKRTYPQIPPNLKGTKRGEAVEILAALGIYDFTGKEDFSFENTMTRAEFGTLLEKFYADENVVSSYKEINASSAVTYNDAARGFINVLGYDTIIKSSKTRAYLSMASDIGLTDGLKVNGADSATNTDILLMLYNMTEINPLRPEVVGNPTKYSADKDETIYSEYYNMYKQTGIVTGTAYSMLAAESTLSHDTVEIDGELYYIGNTKAEEFLGLNVSYYYVLDPKDDTKTLICISEHKNEILRIASDDIISFAGGKYTYYNEKGKEDDVKISVDASIIYNGQYKASLTNAELNPDDGTVVFIDADRNGTYETIKIENIKYLTVNRTDVYKTAFYGMYGEVVEFDGYDKDTVFDIRDAEGKIVKLSGIVSGDLLAIKESKGAKKHFISINVLKDTADGAISEISISDAESSYIVIDDVSYRFTKGLLGLFETEAAEKPNVSNSVRLMLTENGKVAGIKLVSLSAVEYGYIIGAQMGKRVLDANIKFKILKPDSEIAIFETTDKITLDGNRVASSSEGVRRTFCPDGVTNKQLVGYRTNDEGKIVMLDTSYTDNTKETSVSLKEVYNNGTEGAVYYVRAMNTFGNMAHLVSDNAIVYIIPCYDMEDEEIYEVGDVSLLTSGRTYQAVGYSTKDIDYVSDLIIIKDDRDKNLSTTNGSLMLVNKITKVVNSNGDERTKLTGLVKNSETSILVDDRTTAKVLESVVPGDIIRYRLGVNGELTIKDEEKRLVTTFQHTANLTEKKKPNILSTSTSFSGLYMGTGTVLSFKEGYMQVELSTGAVITIVPGKFNISKYNKEKGIYEASTQGAIVDKLTNPDNPSTVFIRTRSRYAEEIVIYE